MRTLRNIALHHAGGFQGRPHASSLFLTATEINEAHRLRWNFESRYFRGSYVGYNFIYDPKSREFTQHRAIGEETAAQRGHNWDTISICILGNYSIVPGTELSADRMTAQIERDVARFALDLIDGTSTHTLTPDATLDLSIYRVHPHRHFQAGTECYGTALSDRWIASLLARYTKDPDTQILIERVALLKQLLALYLRLKALYALSEARQRSLGASPLDRSCEGMVELVY